jgi:5'(3')-deoxyribonucleotidase
MANTNNQSQYPITFVEIIFTVVIGASILKFSDILFPPKWDSPNFWALFVAYFTAIASWFGWHQSTNNYPYTKSGIGRTRSIIDAIIVVFYVALLYFGSNIDKYIIDYLLCFVLIFILYIAVGEIRCKEYQSSQASNIKMLIVHTVLMITVLIIFLILSYYWPKYPLCILYIFIILPGIIMVCFRYFREWRNLPWISYKKTIAIDLDGVLVEQVIPVLNKICKSENHDLCKHDITDWQYPVGDSNIKVEIEKAEQEERFVLDMPPIPGGSKALKLLSTTCNITIATSRESNTDSWSRQWLANNNIIYNTFINTRSEGKLLDGVDILIDDYIENIRYFLSNGNNNRQAILFAQPWNWDVSALDIWIKSGRVKIAHSWEAVTSLLMNTTFDKKMGDLSFGNKGLININDSYILQAISCFLAATFFVHGITMSELQRTIYGFVIPIVTYQILTVCYLVFTFFFASISFVDKMKELGSRIIKSRFWWSLTNILTVGGVAVAWLDGFVYVKYTDPIFPAYFWGGSLFIILLSVYQVITAYKTT